MNATTTTTETSRDQAIKAIRAALKNRSGKTWSVKGGTGSSWGWISIDVPPARRMNLDAERAELAALLNLGLDQVRGGANVPARDSFRVEFVARAQGVTPIRNGVIYWD